MAAPLIGLILSTGIFPIILAIFTIFGIFSRNKFFLAGALVIATYYDFWIYGWWLYERKSGWYKRRF